MDNLFDWENPDKKTHNFILQYGEQELAKVKRKSFYTSFFLFIIFEFWPLINSVIYFNQYYLDNDVRSKLIISLSTVLLVIIFSIGYYFYNISSKKKILLDIRNNKIKTIPTVVKEKKIRKSISVQLLGEETKPYTISKKLYKEIESGSSLLAIKYEKGYGFYDKYDFISNPNTIVEEE